MTAAPAVPVTCDRCRAEGRAGHKDFAELAPLLDFTPVQRRARIDGWTAERQRAFILALAQTGSPRRAAHSIDMAQFGAEQLRKADDSESFNLAWERALAWAEELRADRLAKGIADAAGHRRDRRRRVPAALLPAAAAPDDDEPDADPLAELFTRYVQKLQAERGSRLAGDIWAADLYLRQLTFLEVMMEACSGDLLQLLQEKREAFGPRLVQVADTPAVRLLDVARRAAWAKEDGPPSFKSSPARGGGPCEAWWRGPTHPQPESPHQMTTPQPTAPGQRSFSLNSEEAHDLLCRRWRSYVPTMPKGERPQVIPDHTANRSPEGEGKPPLGERREEGSPRT